MIKWIKEFRVEIFIALVAMALIGVGMIGILLEIATKGQQR